MRANSPETRTVIRDPWRVLPLEGSSVGQLWRPSREHDTREKVEGNRPICPSRLLDCLAVLNFNLFWFSTSVIDVALCFVFVFFLFFWHFCRQGNGASQQMQHLLLCMPCIRQVDSLLRRFWALVRRDARVPMNKLFLEMLESPLRWTVFVVGPKQKSKA